MDRSRARITALRAALCALAGFALLHHAPAAVDVYRELAGAGQRDDMTLIALRVVG